MFVWIKKNKIVLIFLATTLLLSLSYFLSYQDLDKSQVAIQKLSESVNITDVPKKCSGEIIPESAEGPYYKSGSPKRNLIYNDATEGRKIAITGYVYDKDCNPLTNAWLDFWQADGKGSYDNQGYNLRGHQFTDSEGKYKLETKMPGEYPGRTAHIHVKVRASQSSKTYTTQLYFPTSSNNSSDSIFDQRLLVDFTDEVKRQARFDFVIDVN